MIKLLAIESSCDETSASVCIDGQIRSNVISSQLDHADYGGVVPELASRLHQQQIVPVVRKALLMAETTKEELDAIAFTRGPGLLGSLLVGTSFAKAFAYGLGLPLIDVNHMQAHVLANFLSETPPQFPFICLTVSGGHTQLVLVHDYQDMELIGSSIDDAAGEAFDKAAKLMGLPYPGGPQISKAAKTGDKRRFRFATSHVGEYDYSFSGMKTSFLYFLRDNLKEDPDFIAKNLNDICASYQHNIVGYLLKKLERAAIHHEVRHLAIAGGVSADWLLREQFAAMCAKHGWQSHIPAFQYCTDNAAMIAIASHFKFLAGDFTDQQVTPYTRGFSDGDGKGKK